MGTPLAVEAAGLGKAYDRKWALRNVDLRVQAGERVVLLGHNGAGKTTLMRLLSTLATPTRGWIRIRGLDPARQLRAVRRRIGVVAHRPLLYDDLTARENLRFFARLYEIENPEERFVPLLESVGLGKVLDAPVRTYSRGMQQRLALIRAVLHDPALLLLDEPDTGLDQNGLRFLESLLRADSSTRAVLFTTHNLEFGLGLADRVVVLSSGGVVYEAATAGLEALPFQETYRELVGVGG